MFRTPFALRPLVVAATVVAVLALSPGGGMPSFAQASRYAAEIAKIDIAQKQVTLKASMGQQTMRVASGVALDALKPGDKVLVTFGQQGTQSVITSIEVLKS